MSQQDGIIRESTPPLTSEEGTNQRHQSVPGNSATTMALLANTFKDTMCEMMMQMSQENRAVLAEMMRVFNSEETRSIRISDVYFPSFDPDKGTDVREWVDLITRTQAEYKLKDHEVRLKAAGVLKGRAQSWADDCLLRTTTWAEMRDDMLQTFEPESRYFSNVLKFRRYSINDADNIPEYISNVWKMFKKIVKPDPTEEDAVEFVIGSIIEDDLRTELLNAKCQSVPELIAIAKTMRKRKLPPNQERLLNKKIKTDGNRSEQGITCFVCGKQGHRARWCNQNAIARTRTEQHQQPIPSTSESMDANKNKEKKRKECTYCFMTGHTYETCFKRLNAEKNINLCQVKNHDIMKNGISIVIGNKHFQAIFDSGADCSLVRESIALSLPGSKTNKTTYLKGIGPVPVMSFSQITSVCYINGMHLELDLHIVLDHELPADILIGRDILNIPGLKVTLSHSGIMMTREEHHKAAANIWQLSSRSINTDIKNKEEIERLMSLLKKYEDYFREGISGSRIATGELSIRLKNPDKIVNRRPYRLTPVEREKVKTMIKELQDKNIIRESNSPFASPIIMVKKKNGEDRLCVDYRELNANTVRDHYPLPLISEQLDQLADAKYYTCLDMAAGFHQVPISATSIEKTAFVTPDGQYEYLTMPFGLTNAPSVYQRAINKALGDLRGKIALVYMDDVLIPSRTIDEGIKNLEQVLEALTKCGFSINIKKCSFLKVSVEYLGFIVTDGKVRPSTAKVEALARSPPPTNVKQLRQFNGLAGYFRRFICNFSTVMIPLYNLTKTGVKWDWTEKHEAIRAKIINYLTSAPLLTIFQENYPIELHTDASAMGFGAVLIQVKNGIRHVIGYFSMRTTPAESKYHSYELETLAIVRAIKHFRHFLYGRKFTVMTDCNAVKASRYKQELLPRIHRWWAFLQNFEFEVEYRKGEKLKHADFFSRNPLKVVMNLSTKDDWLIVEQRRDTDLSKIIKEVHTNNQLHPDYVLKDNVLHYKTKINDKIKLTKVVPQSYQWSLINTYHEALKHMGWEKTLAKLKENFWFPKMSSTVRSFVEHCVICKTMKGSSGAIQSRLHTIEKIPEPFHTIHIDISGKLSGNASQKEYVFVAIDAYTKFVMLQCAKNKTQASALKHLQEIVFLFGAPRRIIVDGDGAFISHYKDYCDQYGIELHQCAGYTSRANGQVERIMRIIKNGLTVINNTHKSHWTKSLGALQLAINSSFSKATGHTPIELLTGKRGSVPPELLNLIDERNERINPELLKEAVLARMTEQAKKDKTRYDKSKAKVKRFEKGEYVLLKEPPRLGTKLSQKYDGPFEIRKVLLHDRYEIRRINGRGRSRKVCHEQLRSAPKFGVQSDVAISAINKELENEEYVE